MHGQQNIETSKNCRVIQNHESHNVSQIVFIPLVRFFFCLFPEILKI